VQRIVGLRVSYASVEVEDWTSLCYLSYEGWAGR